MSRSKTSKKFLAITIAFFVLIIIILITSLSIFFSEYHSVQKKTVISRKVVDLKSADQVVYGTSTTIKEKTYQWNGTINKIDDSKIYFNFANQEIIAKITNNTKIIKTDLGQTNIKSESISLSDLGINDKIIVEAKINLDDNFEVKADKVNLIITPAK